MRYFRALQQISDAVRQQAMSALQQPNGRANEPWSESGDFVAGGFVYLALSPHQYEGGFWGPLVQAAIAAGVEEITEQEYRSQKPVAVEE